VTLRSREEIRVGDLAAPRWHTGASGSAPTYLVLEATSWSVGHGRPVAELTLLESRSGCIMRGSPAHLWQRLSSPDDPPPG